MEKEVIRTAEARAAIAEMTTEEKDEFLRLSLILHETGRLEYPYGEKVGGEEKSRTIPLTELKKARKIKRKYGL